MRYRMLGEKTGLRVSELALGAGMLGRGWGYGAEPEDARRIVRRYLEAGGNFIDTSESYQFGESERLLGEFIASERDGIVLATKYSLGASPAPALATLGNSRKAMVQAVEASLRRLKTDRIDLYFVHMADSATPMEEMARGLDDLVRAGKIVYGGLSNFPAWRIAIASVTAQLRGWTPLAAIQVEHSLLQRSTESELLPMAQGLGLGVMGWSPMAGGLLTGKYRKGEKGRATELKTSVLHDGAPRNDAILDGVFAVAEEVGAQPGQVAVAWVLAKGVLPVIGPRTLAQLEENLGAADVKLSEAQLQRLDELSAVPPSHPHELLTSPTQRAALTGGRWEQLDHPSRTVA